ncbi:MAG TPA: hypothetical protein PK794_01905, partial [Armatimonadota bacterium]|nr:hypothetical protein [Armatimonadota bacterium]
LQDGSLYQLHPEVKTADAAGAAVALTAIGNGHDVTLRVTPGTTTAWAITVPADAALAPVPPAAAQPTILTVGAQGYAGPVKAGGSVTIQVSGTPHADRVTARIGDVLQPVTLHEVEPGKYQASITVAPNTNATNVPIIAAMTLGGVTSAEVKSAQLITLDTTPPVFNALIPAQDAQVFERAITIQAAFSDPGGSGVNPAAVTLTVNGMDVTKTATVTEKGISFTVQNLALGVLPIRLQIADQAKNAATVAWNVTVATPPAAQAATLAHDAAAAITAGKVVTFTAKLLAAPVKMEWYLGNTLLAGTPTRVAGTNTYTLAYTIAAGDAIGAHAASIRVFSNATQSQVIFAPTPVVIAAPVRAFAVTAPADKSAVTPQLAVTGEAPAGSPVRVTVSYSKVALILVMQGDLYKGTVVAGDDGKWTTPAFETELLLIGKVDQYSVKAELLDGNGATVQTITRTLTPR